MFIQREQIRTTWHDLLFFSRTSTDVCLSPLQRSCVAVDTMDEYKVQLNIVGEWFVNKLLLSQKYVAFIRVR